MPLPTARNKPVSDPAKLCYLVYGPPKIGKSTFANTFPRAVFAEIEPALEHLECFKSRIKSWAKPPEGKDESFESFFKELKAGKHKFETAVIDTVDGLHGLCHDFVCEREEWDYPPSDDKGRGWTMIREEFKAKMWALRDMGHGVIFTSHLKREKIETQLRSTTMMVPSMSDSARRVILPIVNVVARIDVDPDSLNAVTGVYEDRVLYIRPSPDQEGGSHVALFPPVVRAHYDALVASLKQPKKKGEK